MEALSFMTLERDAKFEEKLTCGLENNMKNLAKFGNSKLGLLWDSFIPNRKRVGLKTRGEELCVMTMKKDGKELTSSKLA